MVRAAFQSAWAWNPHAVQANDRPQPWRDSGSRVPHAEQVCDVPTAGTTRISDPYRTAL